MLQLQVRLLLKYILINYYNCLKIKINVVECGLGGVGLKHINKF